MEMKYNMDQFFNWLTKPMLPEEIDAWYKANNIIPEMSELFRDFCFSLLKLVDDTYLGNNDNSKETNIGLSQDDKTAHFTWCWNKTLQNFEKENIKFEAKPETFDYFKTFFMEVYYNQEQESVKRSLNEFFVQIFSKNNRHSKSDIEMFTELYKLLEKSLQI